MMDKKFAVRKIYSLLSVIFIGAIGSGVWDLFLKDFIYQVGEVLVKIATSFYQGYSDRLYENVGIQFDRLQYLPSLAIIALVIMSPVIVYLSITIRLKRISKASKVESDELDANRFEMFIFNQVMEHRTRFKVILIIPFILSTIPYVDLLIVSSTNNRAIRIVERRLDIVRPYVSEAKYYQLISNFRMVENRESLQNLINEIDQLAYEQRVKLPELKLYAITSLKNSSK
jgi:hypothetical protein